MLSIVSALLPQSITSLPAILNAWAKAHPHAPEPIIPTEFNVIKSLKLTCCHSSFNGHLGLGAKSKLVRCPIFNFSSPAHAIIAALSVHKFNGGAIKSIL